MRVHVVSDVHGNAEALRRAGDGADALLVLGDLVDFVDYHDPAGGILGRVLGPEVSARFGQLRAAGRPGELVRLRPRARGRRCPIPPPSSRRPCGEQYTALFAAMTAPTYAIPGNVDVAAALAGVRPARRVPARRPGRRRSAACGSGSSAAPRCPPGDDALPRRPRGTRTCCAPRTTPPPSSGSATVDVLCSHAPPAVPELAYDVVARRAEAPSTALLATHPPRPAPGGAVRARAPAARGPRAGGAHRVRQRRPLPPDGHAVRAAAVAVTRGGNLPRHGRRDVLLDHHRCRPRSA